LGFVRIDDEIDGLAALAVHERPLEATGETRATAATQAGLLDLLAQLLGFARERLLHDLVAAVLQVASEVVGVAGLVDVSEDQAALLRSGHCGVKRKVKAMRVIFPRR